MPVHAACECCGEGFAEEGPVWSLEYARLSLQGAKGRTFWKRGACTAAGERLVSTFRPSSLVVASLEPSVLRSWPCTSSERGRAVDLFLDLGFLISKWEWCWHFSHRIVKRIE